MASNDLARLVVRMEAQTAKYQNELEKANKRLGRFERQAKKSLKNIRVGFNNLAAGLSVGIFAIQVKSSLEFADSVQKLGIRLGATTEFLSEMRFVAEQTGVKVESLNMGLQRMVRRVSEAANGTGEAVGALDELGLSAVKLETLNADQQFLAISEAISKVGNQSDRVRLAMKLFDSEGVALVQTMDRGAEGINALREEARRLGLSLSQDMADQAARSNDAINRMQRSITGLTQQLAIQLGPTIEKVSDFMANNLQPVINFIGRAFDGLRFVIIKVVDGIIVEVQRLIDLAANLPDFLGGEKFAGYSAKLDEIRASLAVTTEGFKQGAISVAQFSSEIAKIPDPEGLPDVAGRTLSASETSKLNGDNKDKSKVEKKLDDLSGSVTERTQELADVTSGVLSRGFFEGFDGIKAGFGQLIQQMIQQFISSGITQLLASIIPGGGAATAGGGLFSKLFGFATGGSFEVGGRGGTDANLVAFRATRGERVTVSTPGQQQAMGAPVTLQLNAIDAQSGFDFIVNNRGAIASAIRSISSDQGRPSPI